MKIDRIDEAIETCHEHLQKSGAAGTEIEAYLTRYLLILMHAAFEEHLKQVLVARCARTQDSHLEAFARSCTDTLMRSIKTSELAGLLGRFGDDYKQRFKNKVTNTKAETFFNNIVTNRHLTAHQGGANVTFKELVDFYEEGHTVLDALAEAVR